ncbi:MAG: TIGR03936 family radical SAM-associated protein, partial [Candidatus Omnitrophica bacterium]|nr:TIGR03936 family radical SAM-associated protein [Candidatus Omnitrophota bacterium]
MHRLRIFYRKEGIARFISERNFQRVIERILRRMELPLKFTEGFSPHPKISFGHPLPVGVTGINERFDIFLVKEIDTLSFLDRSREFLPEGIIFFSARWIDIASPSITSSETFAKYIIETSGDIDIEHFKKMGRISEFTGKKLIILVKIKSFSHKELMGLLLERKIESIT